ncbi:hypothetical protein MANES_05G202851v8 [Manihot esculenta]|uniref:Uncharacterized protein n=1 Tax=Manihot esculenta TaxID=3983 RepID=A0ACB7HR81_MANES|nr:hypothetical protein MANES_05G202851v8 [Manihot esculenta]
MIITLKAKDKLSFINGRYEVPKDDPALMDKWHKVDNMVTSWILNSLSKDLAEESWDGLACFRPLPIYDHAKNQILLLDPLPSVNKAYSMILRIEKQRKLHINALAGAPGKKDDKICIHCKSTGHTMDICFKVHGYSEWFIELKKKNKGKTTIAAFKGFDKGIWVIDIGAITHMCYNFFAVYQPHKARQKFLDGNTKPVTHAETVFLNPKLILLDTSEVLATGSLQGRLYKLDAEINKSYPLPSILCLNKGCNITTSRRNLPFTNWHAKLGHYSQAKMLHISKQPKHL